MGKYSVLRRIVLIEGVGVPCSEVHLLLCLDLGLGRSNQVRNVLFRTSPYIFVYNCQRERIIVPFRRTDDQAIPRMWIKSASDTVYLCSFQKNGYASGHVLRCGPCFPQLSVAANLSYPAGFSDKRRPQFLRSASPQMGAAAAPIRGHASRCNSNAANRLRFPDSVFFLLFSIFTDGRLPE